MLICIFVLGTVFASFINVVIYRVPLELNFIKGRSICPKCHHQLKFYDLIPIISWLILKRKCRYCHESISIQYPIIECLGGILAVLCFCHYGHHMMSIISFLFSLLLIAIAMIDYHTMLIPDGFIVCIGILAIISLSFMNISFQERIVGFFIMSLPMFLINLMVADSFGGGDIKMVAAGGLLMGYSSIVIAVMIAIVLAGLKASSLLYTHKIDRKGRIAFGPYLSIGMFIALLYGNEIWNWYMNRI